MRNKRNQSTSLSRQFGFTLSEVMVTLAVSGFLLSGVTLAYMAISNTVATSKQLENAQEVLRYSAEVFSRSLKQTQETPVIPNLTSLNVVQSNAGATACDGTRPAVPFTENYTFVQPNLVCDAGNGETVLLTGIADISYQINGNLVAVTVTPENLDVADLANGFELNFALTSVILSGAM